MTIKKYIEWVGRVRTFDPNGGRMEKWYCKERKFGRKEREEKATDLERKLFLLQSPMLDIQPFENGRGRLVSNTDVKLFTELAEKMGLVKRCEFVQGGESITKVY